MSAPIRPTRKPQTATDTTPAPAMPATIALADVAAIRWRANGTDGTTVTLTADRGIAASIDARAVYGEGGRADFTLVMREKGGAS